MMAYFSIIIPAKGRPSLACDALSSILRQDFNDFEIIFSNNGADPEVHKAISPYLSDCRIRYIEHDDVLSMPTHWEQISLMARGKYILVLTDRSVLKRGALSLLKEVHDLGYENADVISWPWDVYYEKFRLLLPAKENSHDLMTILDSRDYLKYFMSGGNCNYPYALPRGLNTCVSAKVFIDARNKVGKAFGALNPDYTFAYQCLLLREKFTYLLEPLMISQGVTVSNGGGATLGDASSYITSLGLCSEKAFIYSPIKAPLVEVTVYEDFLRILSDYGECDLIRSCSVAPFYVRCLIEMNIKRYAKILDKDIIKRYDDEIFRALSLESPEIQIKVNSEYNLKKNQIKKRLSAAIKSALGDRFLFIQPLLLLIRGAKYFSSPLMVKHSARR